MNAIIVDDEEFARSSLFFLLQDNCPQIHISGIAKSVAEARILLAQNQVDLIFLDIAMPGENGFELISTANEHNAHVIFTTAYDQYALKAIKANALEYLLKPIDIDELKEAVEKAMRYIPANKTDSDRGKRLGNLAENLADRSGITKITLPNGQGYSLIDVDDIVYIEADSNYSVFHLRNGDQITVSKVLKEYEEILPDDRFLRIHKSSIINLNDLKEFNFKHGYQAIMKSGEKITVSRRRAAELSERLRSYTDLHGEK
ncbi:LytR/AlgR family response regulator transcription factor [Pedobacter faecalis]|uniref:LytR/AlgR family response regulator transcription factor n=1 Tax=Pedobacter faecalis TaxID=3041495 RepID=UPI00254F7FF8|nr:LytTR family DNA-binding domain-containing protein [Pedobacter sp. ELA7]